MVKHEALAVRRERERILSRPAAAAPEPAREDWVALIPADGDGPAERAERREAIARSREALQALKPQELRALTLLAEGYSYAEIGEITGFSQTKINRCLAEGRERFRTLPRPQRGRQPLRASCGRCSPPSATARRAPRTSRPLREHLRACAHCRATLRAYRAAPRRGRGAGAGAAARRARCSTAPTTRSPAWRSRFGGGQRRLGALRRRRGGGARGAGMAALAKVLAVCAGTVGGAAACVATGVVPAPLALDQSGEQDRGRAERSIRRPSKAERAAQPVEYEPEATPTGNDPATPLQKETKEKPSAEPEPEPTPEPAAASGAVDTPPPPPPPPSSPRGLRSAASSSGGDASGEFGP